MKRIGRLPVTAAGVLLALSMATGAHADHVTVELAALPGGDKPVLEVAAQCEGGFALFQVKNTGNDWPALADIELLRAGEPKPLSKRSMRMKSGQMASFRLAINKVGPGEYGVRIGPSWYARESGPDVMVQCDK